MSPSLLRRDDLTAFAGKVDLERDPSADDVSPGVTPASLVIESGHGSFDVSVTHAPGDPENLLTAGELRGKAATLLSRGLSADRRERPSSRCSMPIPRRRCGFAGAHRPCRLVASTTGRRFRRQ
jgi:2-methylcitrate dehydratase PrpD